MLDTLEEPLSKNMLIKMNKILKRNTTDEDNPRYNVVGFKVVPNIIGIINTIKTSAPKGVERDIDNILSDYLSLEKKTLEDIINFHVRFEKIHPFKDVDDTLVKNAAYPQNAYRLRVSN